jgi:uncharacterized membrane protein YjjB (DUF3815 family)
VLCCHTVLGRNMLFEYTTAALLRPMMGQRSQLCVLSAGCAAFVCSLVSALLSSACKRHVALVSFASVITARPPGQLLDLLLIC